MSRWVKLCTYIFFSPLAKKQIIDSLTTLTRFLSCQESWFLILMGSHKHYVRTLWHLFWSRNRSNFRCKLFSHDPSFFQYLVYVMLKKILLTIFPLLRKKTGFHFFSSCWSWLSKSFFWKCKKYTRVVFLVPKMVPWGFRKRKNEGNKTQIIKKKREFA